MPWTNGLDFHAAVNADIGRLKPEFTFDILNLINLFDSSKGQVEYAAFHDLLVANASGDPCGRLHLQRELDCPARRRPLHAGRSPLALAGTDGSEIAVLVTSASRIAGRRSSGRRPFLFPA